MIINFHKSDLVHINIEENAISMFAPTFGGTIGMLPHEQ